MFTIKGMRKTFGSVTALMNASLQCEEGAVCGLIGMNGSGKTTLVRIISGLLSPTQGEMFIDDAPVRFTSPRQARDKGISMAHQNLSLIPDLTVWENINLGFDKTNRCGFNDNNKALILARKWLDTLGPEISPRKRVVDLSPSEKQIVEICKALAAGPKILILDEPTASLTHEKVLLLFDDIRSLKRNGVTTILVTHRLDEIMQVCDNLTVLRNGETVGRVDLVNQSIPVDRILFMMTGKEMDTIYPSLGVPADNAPAMMVKDLTGPAFRECSFTVARGEILGLGGLQGQGQEELLLALAGVIRPLHGYVTVEGSPVRLNSPAAAINSGIILVPGDRLKEGLFARHSIYDNLVYPHLCHKGGLLVDHKHYRDLVSQTMGRLGIVPNNPEHKIRFLSGGTQQKVVVGKWLHLEPKVLLLNDPVKGVDISAKRDIFQEVVDLAGEGACVILWSTDNQELLHMCHRVLVMYNGRIVAELAGDRLQDGELVSASLQISPSV